MSLQGRKRKMDFDWDAIHKSLNTIKLIDGEGTVNDIKEINNVLKTRANRLAEEITDSESQDDLEILEFELSNETYAIETSLIKEVCDIQDITIVPGVPEFITGVINLRGVIVSVVDLKIYLGIYAVSSADMTKIIIVKNDRTEFGIKTDSVKSVRLINRSDLQAPLPTLNVLKGEFLKGMTRDGLGLLDMDKIMKSPNIIVNN